MSKTPLLDDLRAMLDVAPMTRMRAPIGYVQELNKELNEHYVGDDDEILAPGDVYQVSFPGEPRVQIILEVF